MINRKLIQKEKKYFKNLKKYINDQKYFEIYEKVRIKNKNSLNYNKRCVKKIFKQNKTNYNKSSAINFSSHIDIYNPKYSDTTIKFVNSISGKNNKNIFLNFKKITFMSAAATAMLLSAIHRAKSKNKRITCNYPDDSKIRAVMKKVGIFEALNKKIPKNCNTEEFEDVKNWYKFVSNKLINTKAIAKEVRNIIDFCCTESTENIDTYRYNLELNIGETILNIFDHAYEKGSTETNWVLFARYITDTESLCLIVSDHGIGIPQTFRNYHEEDAKLKVFLNSFIPSHYANNCIKESIEELFTLTKSQRYRNESINSRSGRGTGLKKIKEEIDKYNLGLLSVYSYDGFYNSLGGKRTFKTTIFGTIIEIIIPIKVFK